MNALFFERPTQRRFVAAQFGNVPQRAAPNQNALESSRATNGGQSWSPAVDVVETETEIVLHAELPGVKKEEIEVQLEGDTLLIRGERSALPNSGEENFHRIERRYGRFARTFQFEMPINGAQVEATYENGVLQVRLPKVASRARTIEIQSK